VIRSILASLILVIAPSLALAQSGNPGAEHKWSVGTGIGFASSIGEPVSQSGFLWQLDGQYRITDAFSAGLFMQVIPVTGATIFSLAADSRYHFDFLHSQSNEFLSKLTPYAGFGFGLYHASYDFPWWTGRWWWWGQDVSDNGALFSFIVGLEYDITDHVALTSDMRFNVIAGNDSPDSFYYSWQLIGARYRF
jgi:hypothetical protein